MKKLKAFIKKPMGLFIALFVGTLIVLLLITKLMGDSPSTTKTAKQLSGQKATLVDGDVRYTTQETLNTLTGETENLRQNVGDLHKQFKKLEDTSGQQAAHNSKAVQAAIVTLQKQNLALTKKMNETLGQLKKVKPATSEPNQYQIGGAVGPVDPALPAVSSGMLWVKDGSANIKDNTGTGSGNQYDVPGAEKQQASGSLLNPTTNTASTQSSLATPDGKAAAIPMYTIPQNTWLISVTPEQPLIGVIPNSEQKVINPETVSFVVGKTNLAANNWHLPEALKGIQGNSICQGVFVQFSNSYVQCNITSLTFIFEDGTIVTNNAPSGGSFGQLTTSYGSPYIPGSYNGNAMSAAFGTGFFSAVQGFGNAMASGQQQVTGSNNFSMYSVKNGLTYGLGNGLGQAGQSLNQYWMNLLKSTTSFVFVPNFDIKTKKLLQLHAKITSAIDIDYNKNGRKVVYDNSISSTDNDNLD
tara:strand:- start:57293 stop:58702 length:1410 start_codon:yes stop_codon:yes gene_type:complete